VLALHVLASFHIILHPAASTTDREKATDLIWGRWGCAEGEEASVGVVPWRHRCRCLMRPKSATWRL
jgi:hypothetical protein